jgi:tetratricopeptide (TPR) repeat protein
VTLGFSSGPPLCNGVPSLDAYQLYLKGRQAADRLDLPGLETAIGLYSRAISICPDYALAYSALGDLYASAALISVMRPYEAMPRAKRAALEALRLDPHEAQAFASLGWVTFFFDWQWEQGLLLTRRAVALAPSYAFGNFALGGCLTILRRFDEALACFERAVQIDPLSLRVLRGLSWTLAAAGHYPEAEQRMRMGIALAPESSEPYYMLALLYLQQRRIKAALDCIQRGRRLSPTPLARGLEGAILAAAGHRAEAMATVRELGASREWVDPIIFARIHLEMGETERAIEELRRSIEQRSPLAVYAPVEPLFARLREDRRFQEATAPLNLPVPLTARP